MKKIAIITGASSGLGVDFALQLAGKYHCILVARRKDKLEQLHERIVSQGGSAEVVVCDLADSSQLQIFTESMKKNPGKIEVLINNAGFGWSGTFDTRDITTDLEMIDLNCKTLAYLMHEIGKTMIAHRKGYILNVASTAAFQPGPGMATYFATKAFVLSLSQAVRHEWAPHHIHISTLCPGATKTEFFDHTQISEKSMMLERVMSSEEVVKAWLEGLFAQQDIIIPGWLNKILYYSGLLMPRQWVISMTEKIMK